MKVWLNGLIIDDTETQIPITDRGFLFGDGLFETLPIYNSIPFLLSDHLERLYKSLQVLKFTIPYPANELKKAIQQLIHGNQLKEGAIRITVSRGSGGVGFGLPEKSNPTVLIQFRQIPKAAISHTIRAFISSHRQNEYSPLSRVKSCNSLPYILAQAEANILGVDEAILLNTSGYLAECSMRNLFWVRENIVYTPNLDSGVLPGITRHKVIQLARKNKIQVKEVRGEILDLLNADEAFVTNSLRGIQGLVEINEEQIGNGKLGKTTRRLQKLYTEFVKGYSTK